MRTVPWRPTVQKPVRRRRRLVRSNETRIRSRFAVWFWNLRQKCDKVEEGRCLQVVDVSGGPGRDRTVDLFDAMEARSQLRHRPTLGRSTTSLFSLLLSDSSNTCFSFVAPSEQKVAFCRICHLVRDRIRSGQPCESAG